MGQEPIHRPDSAGEAESRHLAIWSQVDKTPTTAIKDAKVDGQQIKTIEQMYMVRRATEIFGPMGMGWGFTIEEERFDQGAPIKDARSHEVIAHELTHTVRLAFWYRWDGQRSEPVLQFGHTRYVYMTRNGLKTDGEAPKKSVSDAIKKCLSLLGFAADVYAGKFDKADYFQERQAETELEVAEDFDAALQEKRDEFKAWLDKQCHGFSLIPHPASVQKMLGVQLEQLTRRSSIARLDEKAEQAARHQLQRAADESIQALKEKKAEQRRRQQEQHSEHEEEATHE